MSSWEVLLWTSNPGGVRQPWALLHAVGHQKGSGWTWSRQVYKYGKDIEGVELRMISQDNVWWVHRSRGSVGNQESIINIQVFVQQVWERTKQKHPICSAEDFPYGSLRIWPSLATVERQYHFPSPCWNLKYYILINGFLRGTLSPCM